MSRLLQSFFLGGIGVPYLHVTNGGYDKEGRPHDTGFGAWYRPITTVVVSAAYRIDGSQPTPLLQTIDVGLRRSTHPLAPILPPCRSSLVCYPLLLLPYPHTIGMHLFHVRMQHNPDTIFPDTLLQLLCCPYSPPSERRSKISFRMRWYSTPRLVFPGGA